ncbi:MAG: Crp/Fnr family transcriptional regulator, partial [Sulfurovaceae bacterium]|nr:Crp/Fnr family transcriptional regulator [Sulfurovaceae bacterium]
NVLHPYDLRRFEKMSTTSNFKKGEKIFLQGEPSDYMVVVIEGIVELKKEYNNETKVIKYIKPMQFIGESYLEKHEKYSCSSYFMTDGVAMLISYKAFKNLLPWSPKISLGMIKILRKTHDSIYQELEYQRVFSTTQKVAYFLLNHQSLIPQLLYKEMASILFLTPQILSRELKKLEYEKCLTIKDGVIELNHRKLARLL